MSGDIEEGVAVAEERRASKDAGDEAIVPAPTDPDTGLTTSQVEKALEKYGLNEIPAPVTPLYMLFLYQFSGFLPFLIEVAAIVSLGVQDYVDFGIITAILVINACLGFREEYHAKKSLDELSSSLESEIAVRRNGEVVQISTTQLVPGDIILLVGGTVVPADTQWIRGDAMQIDTAALTGEPIPRKYPSTEYGDVIWSGTTVVAGECYGQVMATGLKTEIGRAQADILKDKSVRIVSVFQAKIMVVVQILVSSCLAIVLAVLLVQRFVYDSSVSDSILDALSILIASIPVALPLVLQLNLALGASFLAKEHSAIVTSIPALQDIASMSMLCSDKTGTLTTANMSIITDRIYAADGFTAEETLLYAYLCSNADKKDDPIDRAIVNAFRESEVKQKESEYKQTEIIGFNPSVKRVVAFAKHGDCMITVAKGLPAKIIDTAAVSVDDHELQWKVDTYNDKSFIQQVTETDRSLSSSGYKTIGIAVCEGNARELENPVWKFVGLVPMLDPPRKDTAATIASLHHANISVKMITGDHVNVGIETARLIGLGTNIHYGEEVRNAEAQAKKELIWEADGFAAVLPSDKREVVLTLRNEYGVVTGMTGDGVNDAPALSAAQVGIAVSGATGAAKNAADLILTEPGLSPIYGAVLESRRIFARIKSYVVYRVAASIVLVLVLSIIIFSTGCAVDSLLVIILALLNDISMIPVAYDNADATTRPQLPNAKKLVLQSLFYGVFHTGAALAFIYGLDHADINNPIGLNAACDSETRGFIWFYLVLVTELAIFSVRAPLYFWKSLPSPILFLSVLLTCVVGALIAVFSKKLSPANMGYIILYNIGVFIVADVLKVWFRDIINDKPGEIIESDELIKVEEPKSETVKHMEKQMRYIVHRESVLQPSDVAHQIEMREETLVSKIFTDRRGSALSDGFVDKQRVRTRALSTPAGTPLFTRQKTYSSPVLGTIFES